MVDLKILNNSIAESLKIVLAGAAGGFVAGYHVNLTLKSIIEMFVALFVLIFSVSMILYFIERKRENQLEKVDN